MTPEEYPGFRLTLGKYCSLKACACINWITAGLTGLHGYQRIEWESVEHRGETGVRIIQKKYFKNGKRKLQTIVVAAEPNLMEDKIKMLEAHFFRKVS